MNNMQTQFDDWLDDHPEIVEMEAESLAQMAWRAALKAKAEAVECDACGSYLDKDLLCPSCGIQYKFIPPQKE